MAEFWYRVVVGDPLLVADPFEALTRRLHETRPAVAARMVTRLESTGGVHCTAVAYLPPEAADLALELGGRPVDLGFSGRREP